jgi:hypothetical protein
VLATSITEVLVEDVNWAAVSSVTAEGVDVDTPHRIKRCLPDARDAKRCE